MYYITFPLTHPKNNAFHRQFAHPRSRQAFLQCPSYGSCPPRMSVSQAFCPERWAMSYRTPEAFLRTAVGVGPPNGPFSWDTCTEKGTNWMIFFGQLDAMDPSSFPISMQNLEHLGMDQYLLIPFLGE